MPRRVTTDREEPSIGDRSPRFPGEPRAARQLFEVTQAQLVRHLLDRPERRHVEPGAEREAADTESTELAEAREPARCLLRSSFGRTDLAKEDIGAPVEEERHAKSRRGRASLSDQLRH